MCDLCDWEQLGKECEERRGGKRRRQRKAGKGRDGCGESGNLQLGRQRGYKGDMEETGREKEEN